MASLDVAILHVTRAIVSRGRCVHLNESYHAHAVSLYFTQIDVAFRELNAGCTCRPHICQQLFGAFWTASGQEVTLRAP